MVSASSHLAIKATTAVAMETAETNGYDKELEQWSYGNRPTVDDDALS